MLTIKLMQLVSRDGAGCVMGTAEAAEELCGRSGCALIVVQTESVPGSSAADSAASLLAVFILQRPYPWSRTAKLHLLVVVSDEHIT